MEQKNFKYDLNKEIKVTPEMIKNYEDAKEVVISNNKLLGKIGIATLLVFNGFNNIFSSPIFGIALIVIALIIVIPALNKHDKLKEKLNADKDEEMEYMNNCIKPFIEQIDENVVVTTKVIDFPDYDRINSQYSLGHWLENNYIMQKYNHSFDTNTVIDTLANNDEGFLFFNAKALSESKDKDGHTSTTIEFNGPIITTKTKLETKANVSLYTSSKFLGRETANRYKKIKDTIDTENETFNKQFQVTSKEQSQAFYVLSPLVMENLIKLKEQYGSFGLFVHNGYLTFAFKDTGKILAMPSSTKEAKRMDLNDSINKMMELLKMIYDCKEAIDLNMK